MHVPSCVQLGDITCELEVVLYTQILMKSHFMRKIGKNSNEVWKKKFFRVAGVAIVRPN